MRISGTHEPQFVPARNFWPTSCGCRETVLSRLRSQIALRPTPKQEHTIGPGIRPRIGRLAAQQCRRDRVADPIALREQSSPARCATAGPGAAKERCTPLIRSSTSSAPR